MMSAIDSKQVMRDVNDMLRQNALLIEDVDKKRKHDKADNVTAL